MTIGALRELLSVFQEVQLGDSPAFPSEYDQPLERLMDLIREIEPAESDELWSQYPDLVEWQPVVTALYTRSIRRSEIASARKIISSSSTGSNQDLIKTMGEFTRESYDRVRDMFDIVDFTSARRFVMIGCGPLPVTMLQVLHNTAVPEILGLDVDAKALAITNELFNVLDSGRLRSELADGSAYDFGTADVIYVANLISPKHRVLTQIAETAASHAEVILRDPYAMGRLFAEEGIKQLDPRLVISGSGEGNHRFLSRHVYLRMRDAGNE